MKKYIKFSIVLVYLVFVGCTDVIDVEVPVAEPRLVIEASLDWEKGTLGNEQTIYLSLSTPYFDEDRINPVIGASVKVINNVSGSMFLFTDEGDGEYTTNDFEPVVDQEYTLKVIYNSETYTAVETLMPVVDIDGVYQSTDQGFDKDAFEVNVLFTDPAGIDNFYLMKFHQDGEFLPELFDISDEFTDGNQMEVFYENEDFVVDDQVNIDLYGVSKQYYNYIRLLIEQSYDGGPFTTIPAQLKGNCINITNAENYAFGYFRLTQVSKETYTFK